MTVFPSHLPLLLTSAPSSSSSSHPHRIVRCLSPSTTTFSKIFTTPATNTTSTNSATTTTTVGSVCKMNRSVSSTQTITQNIPIFQEHKKESSSSNSSNNRNIYPSIVSIHSTSKDRIPYIPLQDVSLRLQPPIARRDEQNFVYAGKIHEAPISQLSKKDCSPSTNVQQLLRQSTSSTHPLLDPPIAVKDPYGWMRDDTRTRKDVLNHLHQENAYTESMTSHLKTLKDQLYHEFIGYIQETDYTAPIPKGQYVYYTRTIKGKAYTLYCRAPIPTTTTSAATTTSTNSSSSTKIQWNGSHDTPVLPGEEIYLDVNELAHGHDYCGIGQVSISPSDKYIAYTMDTIGDEMYQIVVKKISTQSSFHLLDPNISIESPSKTQHQNDLPKDQPFLQCDGNVLWGSDDNTLFYIKLDSMKRPYQVYRRVLKRSLTNVENHPSSDGEVNNNMDQDELLYHEHDELFWVSMHKSSDHKFLFITTKSKESSEIHYLDLQPSRDTHSNIKCVSKRRRKVLYKVSHWNSFWLIQTNLGFLPNMKLMFSKAKPNCESSWKDIVLSTTGASIFSGYYDRSLDYILPFRNHVAFVGREEGLPRVYFTSLDSDSNKDNVFVNEFTMLTFNETAYDVTLGTNYEYDTDKVIINYESMITPPQTIEVSMTQPAERSILKEMVVPGYNINDYSYERTMALSRDGETKVPVTLVYRKDIMEKHKAGVVESLHLHLYGYGSYGSCVEANFRSARLPLLNRGMVYALAHVRGGGEMGRTWYEEPDGGKYLCKKNSFNDFIDVAKWLIEKRKITTPEKLSCEGRSAGGLLIGSSINQEPELFRAALLGVPFVDVVATMVDASIPLTVVEWEEWGNPNEAKFFQYMLEYCPMNNVKKGSKYPSCLLTGGLHDPRVQYWEPAKFASQLRYAQGKGSGPVCLKIDMAAGHFSASDRYKYYKELSFDYSFLLDQSGLLKETQIIVQ